MTRAGTADDRHAPAQSRARFRLDAAIIGVQKAATTTLFDRLAGHPRIAGCTPKEPHHFGRHDWRAELPSYARMFGDVDDDAVTLEASTTYTFLGRSERTAANLHAHNPALRVIFVARDPVARIVSAHRHAVERGYDLPADLETAVVRTPMLMENTRYAACLQPYLARFGRGQILVLTFEDIIDRQSATLAKVTDFLGLPPGEEEAPAASNLASDLKLHHAHDGNRAMEVIARRAPRLYRATVGRRPRPVSALRPETEAKLRRELDPEVAQLEAWTGRDLAAWRA